jgi:hypothetical protein
MFETPILFLIFNRPNTTEEVFERIRQLKPKYLFVAADGPRIHIEGEIELCEKVRSIVSQIDWDCEVRHCSGRKPGLRKVCEWCDRMVFNHVEQGIILEDDCLPRPKFFHLL